MIVMLTEHQGTTLGEKELNWILTELESLTNEEAESQLASESTPNRIGDGDE